MIIGYIIVTLNKFIFCVEFPININMFAREYSIYFLLIG